MKYLVIGGSGFIGSYCTEYLLSLEHTKLVRVYDNFSSGKIWHLNDCLNDSRLKIYNNDLYDTDIYSASEGIDVAFHFAANPDIAKAATDPDIDFKQGTALTQIVLEALRVGGCKRLIYASGSGVYGDVGVTPVAENYSPMRPISTYGASKLGCEALICSYSYMFEIQSTAFRFGNVVGGRQTHGVAYDFIKRLIETPKLLNILGNGEQSKPYIHVNDVIVAMDIVLKSQVNLFETFNVAPTDYVSVNEIAFMVLNNMGISKHECQIQYGGGARGWKGDVPIVRLNTSKLRELGWQTQYSSLESVDLSIKSMLKNKKLLFGNA